MFPMKLEFFSDQKDFPFFIHYGKHDEEVYEHTHEDYAELVIVLSGAARHIVNGEAYPIKKGDVFVINYATSHGYQELDGFRICNVMFSPAYFFRNKTDIFKSAGFHALFMIEPDLTRENRFKNRLRLNQRDFAAATEMISHMIDEYNKPLEGRKTELMSCFMRLVVLLSRAYSLEGPRETSALYIAGAVSYMENNFHEQIKISQLAGMTHLSERHFNRIFRRVYHTTPMSYILALRLEHARALLDGTTLTIAEIAAQCGFGDSNYFARQFRAVFHTSPREHRRLRSASQLRIKD